MQAWERRDSPGWPNTRGGVGRGCGPAGDGCGGLPGWGKMLRSPGFTWAWPFVLPHAWKAHPIVAVPGGLQTYPRAALGLIPLVAAPKEGRPDPPPLPPTPGPMARAQSPEHSSHRCSPSLCGTGMLRAARAGVSPHTNCRRVPARCRCRGCSPRPRLPPSAQRRQAPALSRNRLLPKRRCRLREEAATPGQLHPTTPWVLHVLRVGGGLCHIAGGTGCWFPPGPGTAEPVPATAVEMSLVPRAPSLCPCVPMPRPRSIPPPRRETAGKADSPDSGAKIEFISIFIAYIYIKNSMYFSGAHPAAAINTVQNTWLESLRRGGL